LDRDVSEADAAAVTGWEVPTGWRGWASPQAGLDAPVTSTALGQRAAVQSRMFPKVRSWLALGAPIELLSPLSVLRIVVVLELLLVPLGAWVAGTPTGRLWAVLAASGVTAAIGAALVPVRVLSRGASLVAPAVMVALSVGAGLWAGDGRPGDLLVISAVAPVGCFVALFLGGAGVVGYAGLLAATVVVVAQFGHVPRPGAVAVGALAWAVTSTGLVWLLARGLHRTGTVDADTGVPNALGVVETCQGWMSRGAEPVVAIAALSGLAEARQALGHHVATELVRRVVENLGQVVPADAVVGRVGTDEVVVALPAAARVAEWGLGGAAPSVGLGGSTTGDALAVTSLADHGGADGSRSALHPVVDLVAAAVADGRYRVGDVEVALRPHLGLATAPDDGRTAADLMRRAALRANRAAAVGDPSCVDDGASDHGGPESATAAMSAEDLALLSDLHGAVARGELQLAFQPQVDSRTGRVAGVEALLRWTSPTHGSVPPGRFVPLAERTGLIDRLTLWVIGEALDAAMRWRRSGWDVPVSVNLSARSVGMPGLAEWVIDQLAVRQLPSSALTVEVTETAAVDTARAAHLLGPLRDRGVRISIDDFGTGYTSLAALPVLPVDELKVDMQFVRRLRESPADAAIVASVVQLAHALGLSAVAEGVEDAAVAAVLADLGYDLLQGYHYSPAVDEHRFVALLDERWSAPPERDVYAPAR
jgi:EAL domain-containing protein (putative c-di-GMP-specific phosphodiesterase class I)/GGDEF domain-containing protein